MDTVIAAFDAKQKLSELLNRTVSGEEFTITKHGRPVARLGPPEEQAGRQAARAALLRGLGQQPVLGLGRTTRDEAYEP